ILEIADNVIRLIEEVSELSFKVRVARQIVCVALLSIAKDAGPLKAFQTFSIEKFGLSGNWDRLDSRRCGTANGVLKNVESLLSPEVNTNGPQVAFLVENVNARIDVFSRDFKKFVECWADVEVGGLAGIGDVK